MEKNTENIMLYKSMVQPHLECPTLVTPSPKGCCSTRGGSEKGDRNVQGPGKILLWREIEKMGIVSLGHVYLMGATWTKLWGLPYAAVVPL